MPAARAGFASACRNFCGSRLTNQYAERREIQFGGTFLGRAICEASRFVHLDCYADARRVLNEVRRDLESIHKILEG